MVDRDQIARLHSLLQAGIGWSSALIEVGAPVGPGSETGSAAGQTARRLNAIDALVTRAGVPALDLLQSVLYEIDLAAERERKVEAALAAPKATLRLVAWLPLLALGIGQLSGLNSVAVVFTQPIALAAVCLGVGLLIFGQLWSARLVRKVANVPQSDGFASGLLVACLRAGFDQVTAQQLIGDATGEHFNFTTNALLQETLALSKRTGAAVADLIVSIGLQSAKDEMQKRLIAIEKLSVRLMIPLGVTVLPAFALIAILPTALSFITK